MLPFLAIWLLLVYRTKLTQGDMQIMIASARRKDYNTGKILWSQAGLDLSPH